MIGQDPLDRERLNKLLWARARVATVRSIGAVDIALWDLAGQAMNQPIHRLLGSYRDRAPAYASSAVLATKQAYAEEAARFKGDGWTAYKIHPPTEPKVDIEICQAVRGMPISTLIRPSAFAMASSRPAAVSIRTLSSPVSAASSMATQRVPLPQAPDSEPSLLKMRTNASVPGVRAG